MAQYRKKPIVIDAFEWTGRPGALPNWFQSATAAAKVLIVRYGDDPESPCFVRINTPEGQMEAKPGDFIIRGVKGEIYPCKPDIFVAIYDPA